MFEPSGYGISALSYILALHRQGIPVSWQPLFWQFNGYQTVEFDQAKEQIESNENFNRELIGLIYKPITYSHVVIHTVPEYWPKLIESDSQNIGYTAWETDTMPDHWQPLLKIVDRVLVPSSLNQRVFLNTIPELPVSVVPHIVQRLPSVTASQLRRYRTLWGINSDHRIFYSINTWTTRKNLLLLLHTYMLAFDEDDSTTLILKTSEFGAPGPLSKNQDRVQNIFNDILSNHENPAKVVLISDDTLGEEAIAAIHELGDIFVSLSRGEGWGMGAAQAAASGNPVIITGWGGQMDYLPADSPGILKYELVPVRDKLGERSFQPKQKWANANATDAIEKISEAHSNFELFQQYAESVKKGMNKYNADNVARIFLKAVNDT